jgi:predicted HAD superfamily Cof-like phosphohydrolase
MDIKEIKNWFEIAVPEPTIENACVQIGCHYEEVEEMMASLDDGCPDVRNMSSKYKSCEEYSILGVGNLHHYPRDKTELLDSLCDQIVTAIGVAHMLGMDIEGALAEVNRSNHSKFEDGKAVFNEQGKIAKGKNYTPPDLEKFIYRRDL